MRVQRNQALPVSNYGLSENSGGRKEATCKLEVLKGREIDRLVRINTVSFIVALMYAVTGIILSRTRLYTYIEAA